MAPVAETQAAWFSELDTFFSAWAGVAPSLEQTIAGGPAALAQATHSLPFQAPFVENATEFMRLLRPSASDLRTVAPQLGHAFAVGAVNLRAATALNAGVAESAQAFQAFAQNPVVTLGLEDLTQTAELGEPLLAGIAPAQAYCNYVTLLFRNVASLQSENIGVGTLARAGVVLSPNGPNAEGFPSSGPANGPSTERDSFGKSVNNNFLHVNPYPNVAGPGQPRLCEAGNENYVPGKQVVGNLPAGGQHEQPRTDLARTEPVRRKVSERDAQSARCLSTGKKEAVMSRLRFWRRHDEIPVVELRRSNPMRVGVVFLADPRDRRVLRLHQARPVQTRLPPEGGVRHGRQHPTQVAGAHRRRRRGHGHLDPARGQRRPGEHGNRTERAADPHRRDAEDQAADVPGRQLVRRTAAGQPHGADDLLRATRSRSRRPPIRSSSTRCSTRSTPTRARTCRTSCRATATG